MHKRQFRLNVIAAATAALFAPTLYAQSAGRVDFATPGVNVIGPNGQSRPAARGGAIAAGETIDTGTGRAQLRFTDGGLVSLQPQTQFRLETYGYDKDDSSKNSIVMNMLKGGLRTITGLIGKTNRQGYKLQTPTATVGIRGTEFSITGFPDGSILVNVSDGAVDVSNRGGSTTVDAGQSALVTTPNSAPTKTDEKPFLPPLAYNNGTQLATPTNPVQDANPITTVQSSPKLTGTYQGQWATGTASSGYPNQPYPGATPTFTLDTNGNLQVFGSSGTYSSPTTFALAAVVQNPRQPTGFSDTNSLGQAGVRLYGNDGVMAWGTWVGGPTTSTESTTYNDGTTTTNTVNSTYPANDPLHWVVGLPVSAIPTSGSATYQAYGGTAPSCVGASCGAITVSSSFSLDFAKYQGLLNLSMKNSGDGVSLNTGSGMQLSLDNNAKLFAGGPMTAASGSTAVDNSNLYFGGFLAGVSASNAGGIYNINYQATGAASDTSVAGALVYSRGGVGGGAVAGNWATTTMDYGSNTGYGNNTPPLNASIPSFFTLDSSGALQDFSYGQGSGGYSETRGGATAVVEGQADGVLTWGHWTGGPTQTSSSGNPGSNTYDGQSGPLHYITGAPATNIPTSGVATYSQVGMTTPSCGGSGASCGNITINSSLNVDFAAYAVKLNFSLANDDDGVQLVTAPGGASLITSGQRFTGKPTLTSVGETSAFGTYMSFDGFFAGNGATHAGAAYNVSYGKDDDSTTNIAGALAYKRGDVGAAPVAGNWGIINGGRGAGNYQTWTADDGGAYQLDGNGLVSASGGNSDYGHAENRGAATSVQEGSADGVLTWGHWVGGPSTANDSESGNTPYTYGSNDPLHYVTGTPVTAMPTTGVATYSQVGYTTPSCLGAGCTGSITINSSMSVDFLNGNGKLNFALANTGDGVKLTTAPGGAALSMYSSYLWNDSVALRDDAGSSGSSGQSMLFEGFLAGATATHAGAVYSANYTANNAEGIATTVSGAVGYKQSSMQASPTPVSQGLWAVGTLGTGNGTSLSTPTDNTYSYLLDGSGALNTYSTGQDGAEGSYTESAGSASAVREGGTADGVLTWGHWTGGPTQTSSSGNPGSSTYDNTSGPLHYVTGTPVSAMPTAGTATYAQAGMTTPSCSGLNCGSISVNSSMFVDFSQYTAKLNFALANSGDGVKLTTASGGANLNIVSTPFIYSTGSIGLVDDAGSTGTTTGGSLAFQGFFAGAGATGAGGVYNVAYYGVSTPTTQTNIAGALAYTSGGVASGNTTVAGGNWAVGSADYATNVSDNTTATTGYVLGSGALTGYGSDANYTGFQTQQKGSATAIADGNDGVMSWGRWTGGPTSINQTFSSGPMYYVAGLPVTNMPTSGTATYTSYGGSQISCIGAACGGGAISASSTMLVDFGARTGTFNIALANANDGAKLTGTAAMMLNGAIIPALSANLTGTTSAGAISGGSVNFNGFLAGAAASHAGGVFAGAYIPNGGGQGTGLGGSLVYQRGPIGSPP